MFPERKEPDHELTKDLNEELAQKGLVRPKRRSDKSSIERKADDYGSGAGRTTADQDTKAP